jgi:8-oxo-dGTP diphosphatase
MPVSDQVVDSRRYLLVPRTLIFLTSGERVLLILGSAHKTRWANLYNGLGGHIERGEDVLSAARRELQEETGIDVSDLWLCGVITIDTGEQIGIAVFVLRGESERQPVQPSPEGAAEWVEIARLGELPLVEDLAQLLPRVLQMKPGDAPFAAQYSYSPAGELAIRFGGSQAANKQQEGQ